jgi:PIN domain nuclease of toxin-antitoxin system
VGSAEVILLDTHAAVWVAVDNRALGKHSEQILKKAVRAGELAVSAISFWEIALLVTRRRLRRLDSVRELRERLLKQGIIELPLTGEIAVLAGELESLHGDPADRFIAATAIVHDATLVTAESCCAGATHCAGRTPSFDLKDCPTSSAVPYSQSTASLAGSIRCM